MKYVGIETQQRRNNTKSLLLLSLFPLILAGATYLFCLFVSFCVLSNNGYVSDDFESVVFALGREYFSECDTFRDRGGGPVVRDSIREQHQYDKVGHECPSARETRESACL